LTVIAFQIKLVNSFDRFPINANVPGHIGYGHQLAQLIDIAGQSSRDPKIRVKELQILDMDTVTVSTKHFAIFASHPQPGSGEVQIPKLASGPAVNTRSPLAASVANGLKTLVGLHPDLSSSSFGGNRLFDNFDSTEGEIWCYTDNGHCRPPLDKVFLGR